jgi:hypothetical protein
MAVPDREGDAAARGSQDVEKSDPRGGAARDGAGVVGEVDRAPNAAADGSRTQGARTGDRDPMTEAETGETLDLSEALADLKARH